VGDARQWNGRLGKQDNCQVGVFGALGRGDRVGLNDARLYLPKEWTDDAARCEEACVPRAQQVHQTKTELAEEIVRHARAIGVRFEWVDRRSDSDEVIRQLHERHRKRQASIDSAHLNETRNSLT
jgi:SRSO17 transposase